MDFTKPKIVLNRLPVELAKGPINLWLVSIAERHNYVIRSLCYSFVSREKIQDINLKYLQHDYATDIITFGYGHMPSIEADIFICPDVVYENALIYKQPYKVELLRVVCHGILHLVGFNDTTEELKLKMRHAEEQCLREWKKHYGAI